MPKKLKSDTILLNYLYNELTRAQKKECQKHLGVSVRTIMALKHNPNSTKHGTVKKIALFFKENLGYEFEMEDLDKPMSSFDLQVVEKR